MRATGGAGAIDANLVEIFASAQGEGPHVGAPTLFVRFGRCDLRCAWCDSPETWLPARRCRIEREPGTGRFEERDNPVPLEAVRAALAALDPPAHRFASLTGGEPLLQPEAVAAVAACARELGLRVHLETHGLAVQALEQVLDQIDVVSMDWKLTSDVRRESDRKGAPVEPFDDAHEAFLAVARRAPEVVVKVVVTPNTKDAELDALCRRLARTAPEAPLVLQPVTPFGTVREAPGAAQLLAWLRRCAHRVRDVRLIPQTHKTIGAL
jgi:7-carboxy-7-deazaguanine synthase